MEQNGGSLQFNSPDKAKGHQKVVNAISKAFGNTLNNKQLYTAADVLEIMAQTKGLTGEQYLARYFTRGGFDSLSSAEGRAVLKSYGMSEDQVNGLTEFVDDGKAIVYAAEHGNFSTFVHESFHVLERVTDSTQQLEDAVREAGRSGKLARYVQPHGRLFSDRLFTTDDYGDAVDASERIVQVVSSWKEDANLTKAQEEVRSEILARLFEGYLYDGKTFSPKLKTIFAKLAQWMRRVYKGMETNGVTLTDDIVRAYDRIIADRNSGLAETDGAKGSVFGQPVEQSPEKQELVRKYSDKSIYEQDPQEKHLYVHPKRIAHSQKSKREQAVYAKETDMARRLANHYGVDVFLLPPDVSEGNMLVLKGKNPDGIVDGVFFDAKQPQGKSESSIQKNFRKAVKQADMMYLDLAKTGLSTGEAVQRISDQVAMEGTDYEGFRLVITDGKRLFSEFLINKKELVESSFLGGPGLSTRTLHHGDEIPLGNSNIASNPSSVKPDVLRQGYDYKLNMSNNAAEAYSEGKRPLWKWRKSDISQAIETLAGKDIVSGMNAVELKQSFLERTEWHHVGSDYRKQDFYAISLDKVRNAIAKLPEEELDNYGRAGVYTLELLTDVMHRQHLGKEEAIDWIVRYLHDHKSENVPAVFLYGTYGLTEGDVDNLKGVSGELLSWYNFGRGEDVSWLDHVPSGAVEGKDHIVLGQAEPDVLAQAAYHGSAYLFDKFRTDKVNSGEGSQYFGWGLYFTQSKQIAADYAQRQGDLKFKDGGRVDELPDLLSVMGGSESLKKFEDTVDRISGKPGRWKEVLDNFCVGIGASDNDILQAIDYASFETRPEGNTFKEMMASRSSGLTGKENAVKAALEDFLNTEEGLRFYDLSHTWGQRPHYVYSVEHPDGKYLDWNAPMPEEDRQLIRSRFLQESGESLPDEIEGDPELDLPDNKFKTGRDFYRGLREMPYFRGEPRDISGFLHRLGYAGIMYDAGSIQGGGNGARNLVVFDENDIRITGKTLFQRVTAEQVRKARTRDMERIEKDARGALIRTAGGGTRLMDIARECQSFEEFRDKVSDEFVRGQERIPRMSLDDFARTTWDYMRMLDGGDLYGDHELSEAARDAGSAEALGEWLAEHRPDLEESLKGGNDTTLEAWLRALYLEANGSAEGNVQEATNATAILDEERRRRREKSLDNRFKELVGTDDGLDQVISAFSSDDTQLPPEARIVVDAANW